MKKIRTHIVLGILAVAGLASNAAAQQVVSVTSTVGGPIAGNSGAIPRRSVERYAEMLKLGEDQKATALALHDGYKAQTDAAQKEFQDAMTEARRQFEESRDPAVFGTMMPAARKKLVAKLTASEKTFMGDLRAILTADQDAAFGKVERHRRRETLLRGSISGESVNLVEIVAGLKLDGAAMATLSEPLDGYERELDSVLASKEAMIKSQQEREPNADGPMAIDAERMAQIEKAQKESRDMGLRIKGVNEGNARRIEPLLPENKRAEFAKAVRHASYPSVYRPSRISKRIDEAAKLNGLSSEQRDAVRALADQYRNDAGPMNDRWASAISDAEKEGKSGGEFAIGGGGTMRVSFGGEDDKSPTAEARKSRQDLDKRTTDKLKSILGDKFESLPKDEEQEQVIQGGAIRMIGPG